LKHKALVTHPARLGQPARSVLARFRNIDKPQVDVSIGEVLAPEYDDTPADLVAECQLRKWLGAGAKRDVKISKVSTPVRGTNAHLAVCSTLVHVNDSTHAIVSVAVKEDSPASSMPELLLHWATTKKAGDKWVAPPRGCGHYPYKLTGNVPEGSAWKSRFTDHSSPDGKPLHVLLMQIPMEGILSTGTSGITFVMQSKDKWMHNAQSGKDWFVQLAGTPQTTDLEGLPDEDLYPISLSPVFDEDERADIKTIRSRQAAIDAIQVDIRKADARAAEARKRTNAASAVLKRAEDELSAAQAALRAAEDAAEQCAANVRRSQDDVKATAAAIVAAEQNIERAEAALREVEVQVYAAKENMSVEHMPRPDMDTILSNGASPVWSQLSDLEHKLRVKQAEAALATAAAAAADAAHLASGSLLRARELELAAAMAAIKVARETADQVERTTATARDEERKISEQIQQEVEAALASRRAFEQAIQDVEAHCQEAKQRLAARHRRRHMLHISRFLTGEGPEPLKLEWLHSGPIGRNVPLVPSMVEHPLNICSTDDGDVQVLQGECAIEDLQTVLRKQVRKWLDLRLSSELHMLQYRFVAKVPQQGGGHRDMPLLAWVTVTEPGAGQDSRAAVVGIAVDVAAAGRRKGGLQLHWGGAYREGANWADQPPAGWRTHPEYSWDAGQSAMATALVSKAVPVLDIGGSSLSSFASTDQAAAAGEVGPKEAYIAILQLPLEGIFRQGGLAFVLKNAYGDTIKSAKYDQPFFIELEQIAVHGEGYIRQFTDPPLPPIVEDSSDSSSSGDELGPQGNGAANGATHDYSSSGYSANGDSSVFSDGAAFVSGNGNGPVMNGFRR